MIDRPDWNVPSTEVADAPVGDGSTELTSIRDLRRNDPAAYDRDHNLQARELALIEERQRSERLADIAERGHDITGLDPGLVDEWERDGGLEIN
jgi:hypothetical protein